MKNITICHFDIIFVILAYTIVHFPNGIQIAIKELNLQLSRR